MEIIGHRGAMGYEPENTISSFQKAIVQGVDAVELDVYSLDSGELVVIHDDRLDRTTNGSGYVWDHSFDQIKSLDAGNGQKVPVLDEVLDEVNQKVKVNIELKGERTAEGVASVVRGRLGQGWSTDSFIISSFNHHELQKFKGLLPDIPIAALILAIPLDYASFAQKMGAYAVNPGLEFINKAFVDDAHDRGLKVFTWTVNHPDDVLRVRSMGVDGIFTNTPDVAQKALQQ